MWLDHLQPAGAAHPGDPPVIMPRCLLGPVEPRPLTCVRVYWWCFGIIEATFRRSSSPGRFALRIFSEVGCTSAWWTLLAEAHELGSGYERAAGFVWEEKEHADACSGALHSPHACRVFTVHVHVSLRWPPSEALF